ncbi:Tubulin-tyrosine ligase family, partial [Globisporangium splendens]
MHSRVAESRQEAEKYDFWATTFVLPAEYGTSLEEFKRNVGGRWIMNPIGKAQGCGIFLFDKLSEISDWKRDHTWKSDGGLAAKTSETYIVQKYVENPYAIGGKKFDLRLYVLVTSFSLLVFWIYRAGFGRFSNSQYSQSKGDIDNLCECLLPAFGTHLQMLITRSLLSVQQVVIQDKHCFELYGYDVLIDSDLKSWLLEVNASPSPTADTEQDYQLKVNVVQHTLDVVDMESKRSGKELHVGGFDLIWNNGPVPRAHPNGYSSYLGCTFEWQDAPHSSSRSR